MPPRALLYAWACRDARCLWGLLDHAPRVGLVSRARELRRFRFVAALACLSEPTWACGLAAVRSGPTHRRQGACAGMRANQRDCLQAKFPMLCPCRARWTRALECCRRSCSGGCAWSRSAVHGAGSSPAGAPRSLPRRLPRRERRPRQSADETGSPVAGPNLQARSSASAGRGVAALRLSERLFVVPSLAPRGEARELSPSFQRRGHGCTQLPPLPTALPWPRRVSTKLSLQPRSRAAPPSVVPSLAHRRQARDISHIALLAWASVPGFMHIRHVPTALPALLWPRGANIHSRLRPTLGSPNNGPPQRMCVVQLAEGAQETPNVLGRLQVAASRPSQRRRVRSCALCLSQLRLETRAA
jgi:hypothetical protein